MAAKLDEIRAAAERVAASHGLDVVDVEIAGPAKERVLRVFLEKNAEGRARLKAEIAAGARGTPRAAGRGQIERRAAFRRDARGLCSLQPGFWSAAGCGRPGSRRRVHAGGQFSGAGSQVEQSQKSFNGLRAAWSRCRPSSRFAITDIGVVDCWRGPATPSHSISPPCNRTARAEKQASTPWRSLWATSRRRN